jgi:hypothetical protein
VPRGQRPPKLERRCPLPQTHTRLHQLHDQWHRTAADYADLDDFLTSLNAALVSLRSVPEVLKKGERQRVPDFKTWYATHEAALKADPLLEWIRKARNHVVHEGDLDLHSRARVRVLLDGRELPEMEVGVPPRLTQEQIASELGPRLPEQVRERGVLAVERRWVANDLPCHELLDVLAYGYGKLADVVADAHRQCGVRMQTFGDEAHMRRPQRREQLSGRLSCMVANAGVRTAYAHLAGDRLVVPEWRERTLRRDDLAGFDPGFAVPDDTGGGQPGESILGQAGRWESITRAFIERHGFHIPMVLIYETRDLAPAMTNLYARDEQEMSVAVDGIVEDVERAGAEGIVFIGEMQSGERAEPELLVAALTDDGEHRTWRTAIARTADGAVALGETVVDNDAVPDFLAPIQRAWIAMGCGSSES